MLRALASVVVDHRRLVLLLMAALTVVFGALIPQITINTDLTKYLPGDSRMRQGIEMMEQQFGEDTPQAVARVMIEGLPDDAARAQAAEELAAIDGVNQVTTSTDAASRGLEPEHYVEGDQTLFVLTSEAEYSSDTFGEVRASLDHLEETGLDGHALVWADNDPSTTSELPLWIVTVALSMLALILIAMSASWIEPALFLVAIGMAVAINLGVATLRDSISEVTFSIAAILQLVLSMDYSIILANRYRQERAAQGEDGTREEPGAPAEAMKRAIVGAFSSISSASFTTVVGLLMLLFMSFRIGADLGVVLAAGVAISMVSVLTVLPGLLVMCDGLITRTAKPYLHLPMGGLARLQYRLRWPLTAAFVAIFVGAVILAGRTTTVYTLDRADAVADTFATANPIVLVYDSADQDAATALAHQAQEREGVRRVEAFGTTVGEELTVTQMQDALDRLDAGDDGDATQALDPQVLRLAYYDAHREGGETMSLQELAGFVQAMQADPDQQQLLGSLSEQDAAALGGLGQLEQAVAAGMIDPAVLTAQQTPPQLSETLAGLGQQVDPDTLALLATYRGAQQHFDDSWTMSIEELLTHLDEQMLPDPRFADLVEPEQAQQVTDARAEVAEGAEELVGDRLSRMVLTTDLPQESEATSELIAWLDTRATEELPGEHWLVGDSVMVQELRDGFDAENLRITLLTAAAIFLIVALTFRSVAVPALLVALVQCGVFITISVIGLQGYDIYYLAMLIVQCILMGATIDYAIVLTTYYREDRRTKPVAQALVGAHQGAIHTILTSGLIMILVTGVLGYLFENPTVGQICRTISIGATAAVLLIIFLLPALLAVTDRLVVPRKHRHVES